MNYLSSYKEFVECLPIYDPEEIISYISEKYYSNIKNSAELITKLLNYENNRKRTGNKIYATSLKIMFPYNTSFADKYRIIKKYMLSISPKYKKNLLYLFKMVTIGKGEYALIIAFDREIYSESLAEKKCYKKDIYMHVITKSFCKKDNPNAVLIHKKGDVMKDCKGNVIREVISARKDGLFTYKNCNDSNIKNEYYNDFSSGLRNKMLKVLCKVFNTAVGHFKHFIQYQSSGRDFIWQQRKYMYYNKGIQKINRMLEYFQFKLDNYANFMDADEFRYTSSRFYGKYAHISKVLNNRSIKDKSRRSIVYRFEFRLAPGSKKRNLHFYQFKLNFDYVMNHFCNVLYELYTNDFCYQCYGEKLLNYNEFLKLFKD